MCVSSALLVVSSCFCNAYSEDISLSISNCLHACTEDIIVAVFLDVLLLVMRISVSDSRAYLVVLMLVLMISLSLCI